MMQRSEACLGIRQPVSCTSAVCQHALQLPAQVGGLSLGSLLCCDGRLAGAAQLGHLHAHDGSLPNML